MQRVFHQQLVKITEAQTCHFHVVASTLSRFSRGTVFKFSSKILTATLLFIVCITPPPAISTLSLPRCRFHVVASTLSLPRCRYPGSSGIIHVHNMADMFNVQILIIVISSCLVSFCGCVIPGFPCSNVAGIDRKL